MYQTVIDSNGKLHLERQFGNQRIDLTTGDVKTVTPGFGGMNTVIDESGVHTETGCSRLGLPLLICFLSYGMLILL